MGKLKLTEENKDTMNRRNQVLVSLNLSCIVTRKIMETNHSQPDKEIRKRLRK